MTEKEFIFNSFVIDTVLEGTGEELKLYEIDNNPSNELDDSNLFYVYSTSDENIELIVDKLNEQQKQIQEQKRQIRGLILLKNGLIDDCMKLSEENEQLKQTIKSVYELLTIEVDVFSDKAIEHDLIAYRELQQLDNKDAYYMAKATKTAIRLLKGDV